MNTMAQIQGLPDVNPNLITHEGNVFRWNDGIGSANASDLPIPFVGYVFKEYKTQGFKVRSHKTGNESVFLFLNFMEDVDGNMAFMFINIEETALIKVYDE